MTGTCPRGGGGGVPHDGRRGGAARPSTAGGRGRDRGGAVVLDDDAPGEGAAEAVGVGREARPQLVLLLPENVCIGILDGQER